MSRLFWIAVGAALGIAATIIRSHDHVTPAATDPDRDSVTMADLADDDHEGFFAPS